MQRDGAILIIDGDTPDITERSARVGGRAAPDSYAAALRAFDPTLEIRVARPSWPGFDIDAIELGDLAGAVHTGSGVSWGASDRRGRENRRLIERVFAAGVPMLGSCFGLHLGCVVLGGSVRENPKGLELGVARNLTLTESGRAHPMFQGKPAAFDSLCVHRDEVDRTPLGAALLASNDHTEVQAMAYEAGGVRFWGMQYHPELTLADIAVYLATPGDNIMRDPTKFASETEALAVAADYRRMHEDPAGAAALRWRYGITDMAAERSLRGRELSNWLASLAAFGLVDEARDEPTPETMAAGETAKAGQETAEALTAR